MRGLNHQCWETPIDCCPWWMRLCDKNKWFEDDEIGWVADKGVKLHLTPYSIYNRWSTIFRWLIPTTEIAMTI